MCMQIARTHQHNHICTMRFLPFNLDVVVVYFFFVVTPTLCIRFSSDFCCCFCSVLFSISAVLGGNFPTVRHKISIRSHREEIRGMVASRDSCLDAGVSVGFAAAEPPTNGCERCSKCSCNSLTAARTSHIHNAHRYSTHRYIPNTDTLSQQRESERSVAVLLALWLSLSLPHSRVESCNGSGRGGLGLSCAACCRCLLFSRKIQQCTVGCFGHFWLDNCYQI